MEVTATAEGASKLAASLNRSASRVPAVLGDVVVAQGALLEAAVKRRASLPRSGPPGPRLITGNYVRSINRKTTRLAGSVSCVVGTNAPQGRRLELGFYGTDSRGRRFRQPAYPHFLPALDEVGPGFVAAVEAAAARIVED